MKNGTVNAGTGVVGVRGIWINSQGNMDVTIENTTFGATTSFSSGDIGITSGNSTGKISLKNCVLASPTEVATQTNFFDGCIISQRHDQTSGNHKVWKGQGTLSTDENIYAFTPPSLRMTPLSASLKLDSTALSPSFCVPVNDGNSITVGVYIRKSVAGDGSAYNGNQPRFYLKKNVIAGINSDTLLATVDDNANGTFYLYSGTTPTVTQDAILEFYIDCDGTTGWINVDDFVVINE